MGNVLSVENVVKHFGPNLVLNKASFQLGEGEIVGLIGKNGAGKTTLMKGILGLLQFDQGDVRFLGEANYMNSPEMMDELGYLIDCRLYDHLSASDNIVIQWRYSGRPTGEKMVLKIKETLAFVGLKNSKKKVSEFSFGMKQRLGLALAIIGEPKLLILDEPFVGLDPIGIKAFKDYLYTLTRDQKMAVLMSSHQLTEINDLCNRYLVLDNGTLSDYQKGENKQIKFSFKQTNSSQLQMFSQKYKKQICVTEEYMILDSKGIDYDKLFKDFLQAGLEIYDIETSDDSLNKLFEERPNRP